MNVLIVSEPGIDGVFRYIENFVHHLLAHRIGVHFAYSDVRGGDALRQLVARVEQEGGRTLNLRVGNRPHPGDLRALLALRDLVREVRPDVIHAHSAKAGVLARALPLLGLSNTPLVYQPHAYIGMRPVRGRADFAYDAIERVLGRWSTTITCSYDEQRYALHHLRIPASRVPAVPNGVDTRRFIPGTLARRRELRAAFGLPEHALVLGAMSRSSAQKDPVTLYHAFAAAATTHPDLVLFHVGQGELDAELERIVADAGLERRVVRRCYLATPTEFYQAIDGFALTSRYEGFSLALLEALSADLPLIVTDAPGNGDLLNRPLSHAWRGSIGDVARFTEAIAEWAAERASPAPCNHREIAETCYDQTRAFDRVLHIYARAIAAAAEKPAPLPAYARA
jgi:glycosyltransferase involved in cell wall biosynthesis